MAEEKAAERKGRRPRWSDGTSPVVAQRVYKRARRGAAAGNISHRSVNVGISPRKRMYLTKVM